MGHKKVIEIPKEAKIYYKCSKNNSGAFKQAMLPKMRPRTYHINILYHHLREVVKNKIVQIYAIDREYQVADILTKPLNQNLFTKHQKKLLFW